MEKRCQFWLPKKRRYCANAPLNASLFCGNHTTRSDAKWLPCPVDPSHSVLEENLEGHVKRCPSVKQAQYLSSQPYYRKGVNCGGTVTHILGKERENVDREGGEEEDDDVTSEAKRKAVHSMTIPQFVNLLSKIRTVHSSICADIRDSYRMPEACDIWIKNEVDRKIPYQEKHVMQQASILANMEDFGLVKSLVQNSPKGQKDSPELCSCHNDAPAVVEFGAGRGYLTQMLADCYGILKVYLVERRSYKLKADRSLRKKESLKLERLRIDIEDLNLSAVESLKGVPFLAIGKHLCGPATDLTLRCCLADNCMEQNTSPLLRGLAIVTCCHHLSQWKHYTNKEYLSSLGFTSNEFHAITWFTSWAVDADHSAHLAAAAAAGDDPKALQSLGEDEDYGESIEDTLKKMKLAERASVGFMCKDIIDMGRLMWVRKHGLMDAQLVKYVPSSVSPENRLIVARPRDRI